MFKKRVSQRVDLTEDRTFGNRTPIYNFTFKAHSLADIIKSTHKISIPNLNLGKEEEENQLIFTGNREDREEKRKRSLYNRWCTGVECDRCGKPISKIKKILYGDTDFLLCHECEIDLKKNHSKKKTEKILDNIRSGK